VVIFIQCASNWAGLSDPNATSESAETDGSEETGAPPDPKEIEQMLKGCWAWSTNGET